VISAAAAGSTTQITYEEGGVVSLTTTGVELTEGKHHWEVELLDENYGGEIVELFILISYIYWC
jgi:hypothetical protein